MPTHRSAAPPPLPDGRPEAEGAHSEEASSERAVETLFHAHHDALCRFALSQVHDAHVAEDLVQEVFLGLWQREEGLPEHPKAYLFRGVKNRLINYNRQQRVVRRREANWEARPPSGASPSDARVACRELSAAVRRAVEALPPRQRHVFDLSRNGGLTYAEIAEVLGLSVKTVETHMGRALRRLRERLAEYR